MYPAKPNVKDVVKGSGFGRIVIVNESLRAPAKAN